MKATLSTLEEQGTSVEARLKFLDDLIHMNGHDWHPDDLAEAQISVACLRREWHGAVVLIAGLAYENGGTLRIRLSSLERIGLDTIIDRYEDVEAVEFRLREPLVPSSSDVRTALIE